MFYHVLNSQYTRPKTIFDFYNEGLKINYKLTHNSVVNILPIMKNNFGGIIIQTCFHILKFNRITITWINRTLNEQNHF